eukprot:Opistho-2@82965
MSTESGHQQGVAATDSASGGVGIFFLLAAAATVCLVVTYLIVPRFRPAASSKKGVSYDDELTDDEDVGMVVKHGGTHNNARDPYTNEGDSTGDELDSAPRQRRIRRKRTLSDHLEAKDDRIRHVLADPIGLSHS